MFLQIDLELKPLKWHVPIQSVRAVKREEIYIVTRRARQTGRKDGVIYLTELHLVLWMLTQSSNPSKVVEGKEVIIARRERNCLKGIGWLQSLIPDINATIHSYVEEYKADSPIPYSYP